MERKDLQDIRNKVRSSQMRYLDTQLSSDIFLRINELLFLIEQRKWGQTFYAYNNIPLAFSIPDINILSQEVAFLRNKLQAGKGRGNAKKRKRRTQNRTNPPGKPIQRMRLPELDLSGGNNGQTNKPEYQGSQTGASGSSTGMQVQSPVQGYYSKESEKWTPAEIENWKGHLKDRINSVACGTDEEIQAVCDEIVYQSDGIVKNLTDVLNKAPTTGNIKAVLEQLAISQSFGGDDFIEAEAFKATGVAANKRLIASYSIYNVMKQKRYFVDLNNDLATAQILGITNDPVMNKIESEITEIFLSGIYK